MASTGFFLGFSTQQYSAFAQWNTPKNLLNDNGVGAQGDYTEFETILFRINTDGGLPTDATIDGVEMEVKGKRNAGSPLIFHWLSKDGSALSPTSYSWALSSTTYGTNTFGSSTDMWGLASIVASGDTLYAVIGNFASSSTGDYDYVKLNIHYTPAPSPPNTFLFNKGTYTWKNGNTIFS